MKLYLIAVFLLVTHEAMADPFRSVEDCYRQHLSNADGYYPGPEDDLADLREYCKLAYESKTCDFACQVTSVGWEFAIKAPQSQRYARLRAYFKNPCGAWKALLGNCKNKDD